MSHKLSLERAVIALSNFSNFALSIIAAETVVVPPTVRSAIETEGAKLLDCYFSPIRFMCMEGTLSVTYECIDLVSKSSTCPGGADSYYDAFRNCTDCIYCIIFR